MSRNHILPNKWTASAPALLLAAALVLTGCASPKPVPAGSSEAADRDSGNKTVAAGKGAAAKGSAADKKPALPKIRCGFQYRVEPEQDFTVNISLSGAEDQQKVHVVMRTNPYVQFTPSDFFVTAPKHQLITARAKKNPAGIIVVLADAPDGDADGCDVLRGVDFQGHLKLNAPSRLPYNQARTIEIGIVDSNDKPLQSGMRLLVRTQLKMRIFRALTSIRTTPKTRMSQEPWIC